MTAERREVRATSSLFEDRDYRILIAAGKLVRAYTVIGQLAPDGAVELVALDIDDTAQ